MPHAELFLPVQNPEEALRALKPDVEKTERFELQLSVEKDGLRVRIDATDLPALRAGVNSTTRLVQALNSIPEEKS